ncbi:MAG: metallophosphoesterase [Planctomycetaceae bacterium]|nr:metallophosphoesterase [Planctomycetaceae bacterium]
MRALISDIHGNLEALQAVLADIRAKGVTEIFCLGDVVGYGPNPAECIDHVMDLDMCLLGNHDQAALFDPDGFNAGAERAIFWTRSVLERDTSSNAERRWDFLGELSRRYKDEAAGMMFVHGSARNPLNEYVFPDDVYNQVKMEKIFALIDQYCFQGHTHIPGVFTDSLEFFAPEEIDFQYKLGSQKVMINVGSVGQPRNNDPRSSYVTIDDGVVQFHRVSYDFETTIAKIYDIPDLDNFLGDRLREGR